MAELQAEHLAGRVPIRSDKSHTNPGPFYFTLKVQP